MTLQSAGRERASITSLTPTINALMSLDVTETTSQNAVVQTTPLPSA